MKITTEVEVLDKDICSKCSFLEIENYPSLLFGNGETIGTSNYTQCKNIHMCKYLRNLFATETSPVIEDVNGVP